MIEGVRYSANDLTVAYWNRVRVEMMKVLAKASGIDLETLLNVRRKRRTFIEVLLESPFMERVVFLEVLQVYWPAVPLGALGVFLGVTTASERQSVLKAISYCQPIPALVPLRAKLAKVLKEKADEWRKDYNAVDHRARSMSAKKAHVRRPELLNRTQFAALYKGRVYEDDSGANIEPKGGRLKAPEPYFSGVSSPQGW
jgi:hypothetical protein